MRCVELTSLTLREEKSKKQSVVGCEGGCVLRGSSSSLQALCPSILPSKAPRCFPLKFDAQITLLWGKFLREISVVLLLLVVACGQGDLPEVMPVEEVVIFDPNWTIDFGPQIDVLFEIEDPVDPECPFHIKIEGRPEYKICIVDKPRLELRRVKP